MTLRPLLLAIALAIPFAAPASADVANNATVVKAIEEYLDFTEYGSSVILPEQIPAEDWNNVFVVDARAAVHFDQGHIPGAINIEWRQSLARRGELPRDRMVLLYCNTGVLSAQAVFALRLLGHDNVKVLQGGYDGWKAKGGFEANQRVGKPAAE